MKDMSSIYSKLYNEIDDNVYISENSVKYKPSLEFYFSARLDKLVEVIKSLPLDEKVRLIEEEIGKIVNDENQIEVTKYLSSLSILKDLIIQGWRVCIKEDIYLANPELKLDDKDMLRLRLHTERKAQFSVESNKAFISKMEKVKYYKGNNVSIRDLIGSGEELRNKVSRYKNGENIEIIEPYLQLIDNSKDGFTGFKLGDIWRYFRYTWSIPYKNSPGRNLYYLVRDMSQKFHPIIGIAALGNSVLNLNVRDNYIGWTLDSIQKNLERLHEENEAEFRERIEEYSDNIMQNLYKFVDAEMSEIFYKDLISEEELNEPNEKVIGQLKESYYKFREEQMNSKKTKGIVDYKAESLSILFKKKRACELVNLLESKLVFNKFRNNNSSFEVLNKLFGMDEGKKAISTALKANRKKKIGSNLMEIIVCGSIPPYNIFLGGKLVSLLIASPQVVKDYNTQYKSHISEIASRMKGEPVIRDSRLAFLGTTSLYSGGSSQYNRIKIPINNFTLEYKKLGRTEGYGSVFFSKETTDLLNKMLNVLDGGRKISNVFGEGTSPRMRLISRGFNALGISPKILLNHHSPRIVYGIDLAYNTKQFLNSDIDHLNYYFESDNNVEGITKELISFWKERWMKKRIFTIPIEDILKQFDVEDMMLGNEFNE
jgi:hypothetical protein